MKCLKRYSEVTTTGTSSVTFQSDGSNLVDYTIYGASGGVGDKTENLLDKNSSDNLNGYSIKSLTGEIVVTNFFTATHKIDVTGGQTYVAEVFNSGTTAYIYIVEYDEYDQFVKSTGLTTTGGTAYKAITLDATTAYVRMSLLSQLLMKLIFVPGSTATTEYIPYGYQIPIICGGQTTNIYIGDAPLGEGESISLAETGIQIPTLDGENTLTVDTTVAPTSVSVTSKAWQQVKPKRFDGTNWIDTHVRRAVGYSDRPVWHITDDDTKILYGYHIDGATGDVTYIPGTDNENFDPAAMGTTTFDYGSWPRDAFFIPRPCMLKYDGTVDYFLDPNDYSKKLDGTASDVADLNYGGNCMLQFSLIYHASITIADDGSVDEYFANYKVDDRFECYNNYDAENNLIPYFYVAAFNGCTYDGKMRSISGLKLDGYVTTAYSTSATYDLDAKVNYGGKTYKCIEAVTEPEAFDPTKWEQYAFNAYTYGQEEITQATANNQNGIVEWYTWLTADQVLFAKLATLMCKNLNHQAKFGRGIDSGSQAAKEAYVTGTLNDKGLFWGVTANGTNAVKIFGIENFHACEWKRAAGLIGTSTGYAYKLTHGTKDGSTATSFNTNGAGYKTITRTKPRNGYVTTMHYEPDGFWIPATVGTNRYAVYHYNGNGYALFGGCSINGAYCGSWYVYLGNGVGYRAWSISSALSCKPRAVASAQS